MTARPSRGSTPSSPRGGLSGLHAHDTHTLNVADEARHALTDGERLALDRPPPPAEAYCLKEGFCKVYVRYPFSSAAIDAYDAWLRSFPQADDDPDSSVGRLARDLAALFASPVVAVNA